METLRDSFVGGLLRRGEDDLDPALLGLDEMCGISDGSNTILVLSKSGVAELRLKEAKLASSPPPKAGWEFPTFDLLPVMALTCVLGVGFRRPESFFTKTFSLLLCFPLSGLCNADTLLCFVKLVLIPLLVPPVDWLAGLKYVRINPIHKHC